MEEGKQNFFEEDVTEQKTSDSELDSELESEKTEPTKDAELEGENPASCLLYTSDAADEL